MLRDSFARICALLMLACAPPLLAGCAASSYAGISLRPGAADPELQTLAIRAQAGDKHAQLELGIRYEEGRGVPVDLGRAERLYRLAASDSGGPLYVYTPPVGSHGKGRVLAVRNEAARSGLAEAQARLGRFVNADQASAPAVPAPGSQTTAGTTFAVEDFFPDQLMDGQCSQLAGSEPAGRLNSRTGAGENEDPPDLDCYPVERPQWPAPEGRSAWFYLGNLRNFLVENENGLASDSLSSLLQSSGLLRFEKNGFALYSVMALAMAKLEGGCAIHVGRLAYIHGAYDAFDDTMRLLSRNSRGTNLSAHCTQPEIAAILARARIERREVPIPAEEATSPFAASYFPHSLMDGICRVSIGTTPQIQDLTYLDRNFPMSDPPDLDCYRVRQFTWPAPPGRSTWYYLGNLLGFLNDTRGQLSNYNIQQMLSYSRILEGSSSNGYAFFVVGRLLEATDEVGCSMSFVDLAYRNGVLDANGEANRVLQRNPNTPLDECRDYQLRLILAGHGAGDV